MHQPSSYFVDSLITPSCHGHSFPCSSSAPCNNHRHFRGSRTNCMVPSDWDLALKCICGPNFISIQVENSPVLSATSIFVFHWQHVCFYFYFVCLRICAYAFKSRVHCGSAFEPGAYGLPYCCTWIYVRFWCDWRASCVDSKPKKKRARTHLAHCLTLPPSKPNKSYKAWGDAVQWLRMSRSRSR